MSDPAILTIGHSTHPGARLVGLLRAHGVECLCDVRRHPRSRRHPQFDAEALAATLTAAAIGYELLGDSLGGRRGTGLEGYAAYMRGAAFAAGIERLETLARERRAAIMCAEADWRRCHRQLIADALAKRGWRVGHIESDGGLERHPGSPFAAGGVQQRLG